ncbi:MAG: SymE family type I addiction module toxin [Janthinobacterium lividum]
MSSTARRLKVATFYRALHPNLRTTAQLILCGNWLAAAGFTPGTVAVVEVAPGQLTITPASNG